MRVALPTLLRVVVEAITKMIKMMMIRRNHQRFYYAAVIGLLFLLVLHLQWNYGRVMVTMTNQNIDNHNQDQDDLPQVACVIYTYHGNRALVTETYVTWGQHCQTFDAFSDEAWEYSLGKTTIPLRTFPGHKDDLYMDVKKMWLYLQERYRNGTLHADFVTFSGDDAFFIIPRLRQYLRTLASPGEHTRLLVGGTDRILRESDFPWIGGAGYAVSRQLIEEEMLLSKCEDIRTAAEDMEVSACLYKHGVTFTDTRDASGKYRFCRSFPGDSCDVSEPIEPSDEVVLFHYVNGAARNELYQKYYGS